MKTIKTWLPVFPGFYGTDFEADEDLEIFNIAEQRKLNDLPGLPYDAIKWDYDDYENEVAEAACQVIENDLEEFLAEINFQKVSSPKEYNFGNDSIHITVDLNEQNELYIMQYLERHLKEFGEYLKDKYTSRSGFISSHPNAIGDWVGIECLEDNHKLGAILQFIWYQVNENNAVSKEEAERDFREEVMQDISLSASNYDDCCNKTYCQGCEEFVYESQGGYCLECIESEKVTGEYIQCSCCESEIVNRWEKRALQFKILHGFVQYDKIVCNNCRTIYGWAGKQFPIFP